METVRNFSKIKSIVVLMMTTTILLQSFINICFKTRHMQLAMHNLESLALTKKKFDSEEITSNFILIL